MKLAVKKIVLSVLQLFNLKLVRINKKEKSLPAPFEENTREINDQFYSNTETLKEYYVGRRLLFYRAVVDQLKMLSVVLDNKRVLDVGCGVGFLLNELNQEFNGLQLHGADFSVAAIKASKARFPKMTFFEHNLYCTLKESYDIIFCTEVIEHLEKPFVALQNLERTVVPGGLIVLTVPNGRLDTLNEHINFWSPESWKIFLERELPRCHVQTFTIMSGEFNFALIKTAGHDHNN